MLSSTLKGIKEYLEENLEEELVNDGVVEDFIAEIKKYKTNTYINPYSIAVRLDLNDKDIYSIFSRLIYLGIVKEVYRLVCPQCKDVSEIIEDINGIEEYKICEECSYSFEEQKELYKFVILMYKVINE